VSRHEIDVEQLTRNVVRRVADEQDDVPRCRFDRARWRSSSDNANWCATRNRARFGEDTPPDAITSVRGRTGRPRSQHRRRRCALRITSARCSRAPVTCRSVDRPTRRTSCSWTRSTVSRAASRRSCPGDGGPTPRRHDRTWAVGARHPTRPAQLHARRGDNANRAVAAPLRDRFGFVGQLDLYDRRTSRHRQSIGRSARRDAEGRRGVHHRRRSRGTPRIANRLLRRVRDFAAVPGARRDR